MLRIGPHLSIAKGFASMGKHALLLDANAFGFFLRNPRGGKSRTYEDKDITAFQELANANGIGPLVGHGAYTMNPCAEREEVRSFTREAMADDLSRMARLPGNYYNFHPGCHVGQGAKRASPSLPKC